MIVFRRFYSSTIFAPVTGIGPKGSPVAIVRVSGKEVTSALKILNPKKEFKPRVTTCSNLYASKNEVIDLALVTFFKGPASYTGEDVCEISVHGSKAVMKSLLSTLGRIRNLRPAEPGEFTKRAYLNNKLSLTAAEGINDLIESRNDSQRKRALQAVSGHVQYLYASWRYQLINVTAIVEANIDFGEDELIESETMNEALRILLDLKGSIVKHLNQVSKRSSLIENGVQMVILGRPNVGKSSLINILASKDVSIVSPFSGTTRDVIEATFDIGGQSITVCDTAGLREVQELTGDQLVEKEGMRRARIRANTCDIIMFVTDAESDDEAAKRDDALTELKEVLIDNPNAQVIRVVNKVDLIKNYTVGGNFEKGSETIKTSCKTNFGIDELIESIEKAVKCITDQDDPSSFTFLNQRHESILKQVDFILDEATKNMNQDLAIAGHHLKRAAERMSELTGNISSDDVLDVIFSKFCIGK